ncbi:hypothetical protein B0T16DRAFT_103307 [Cercophora newfieldiana]|uniref:Uncharacterized protein n=1 Tax=Cercophora newfieldiana TaxID=92897 RepID=A0AA40CXA3_9PEZI|nr:hypothetical protein B0T16DRAFT_103307 [Cercophora newfieldiana]
MVDKAEIPRTTITRHADSRMHSIVSRTMEDGAERITDQRGGRRARSCESQHPEDSRRRIRCLPAKCPQIRSPYRRAPASQARSIHLHRVLGNADADADLWLSVCSRILRPATVAGKLFVATVAPSELYLFLSTGA